MDRSTFEALVKDLLTDFSDTVALETHPQLFSAFKPPAGYPGAKAEYLRQRVTEAIEKLRPDRKEVDLNQPEWRPYLILQKRYVEGVGLQDLAGKLAISDRQLRRDHHRAVQALSVLLWNQLYPDQPAQWDEPEPEEETPQQFEINAETIDLPETILGVYRMLQKRFEEQDVQVRFDFDAPAAPVTTDRIILRQILIGLFNDALRLHDNHEILVQVTGDGPAMRMAIDFPVRAAWQPGKGGEEEDVIETVRFWSERIDAEFEEQALRQGGRQVARRTLSLPRAEQKVILVVDDQAAAVNLFKRYLSHTPFTIVGVNHADQVLSVARQMRPAAITLDVMMPKMDGWEILQMLKLDEETRAIPVIVCSAWEEPELSRSLRAAAFLKKPITQKDLLDALQQVGILED